MNAAPSTADIGNLGRRVYGQLTKRPAGFEMDDGDIATEFDVTPRQVPLLLEPALRANVLRKRVGKGTNHWSLATITGAALAASLAAQPSAAAQPAAALDITELQPKLFNGEPPARTVWGDRRTKALALLDKLTQRGMCIEGIPRTYEHSIKGVALARMRTSRERYVFRKPTPATVSIYRIADAAVPLPAAPAPAKALAAKRDKAPAKKKAAAK